MRPRTRTADRGGLRILLVVLAVGVVVRVLALVAFWPGFVRRDAPTYLDLSRHLVPSPDRVVGYSAFLRVLLGPVDAVWVVSVAQHVLGLLTVVLVFALLRRRGCPWWLATLAVVPLVLDGMQLVLEQSVLSDELYQLLLVAAVALLLWRPRPRLLDVALAGLVLGISTLVRVGGEPAILTAVLLVVVVARGWRTKLIHAAVVVVAFVAVLVPYAAWYHASTGAFALTQSGGRALYMRTTTFVDCARLTLPAYERPLCPEEPLGQRLDPTWYGWHDPDGEHGLTDLPAGITPDRAMHDFAVRAIRAQPLDYARVVGRDFLLGFDWSRRDRYEYDTADKWRFDGWYGYHTSDWTGPAYDAHGGVQPHFTGTWARLMSDYGRYVFLPGPVLAALLLLSLVAMFRRRRDAPPDEDQRPALLLLVTLGVGLVLVPVLTAEFVWRYTLPMLTLVPPAAALAWIQLRGSRVPVAPVRDAGDAEDGLAEGRHDASFERPGDRHDHPVVDGDQPRVG